jgi:hypothetical protein
MFGVFFSNGKDAAAAFFFALLDKNFMFEKEEDPFRSPLNSTLVLNYNNY